MQMIDWENSNDIDAMLRSLPDDTFQKELRLFATDCAARVLGSLPESEFALALDMSRQFAIDACASDELQQRVDAASALIDPNADTPTTREFAGSAVIDASSVHPATSGKIASSATCALQAAACAAANIAPPDEYDRVYDDTILAESRIQCDLLRSRIPNPSARRA